MRKVKVVAISLTLLLTPFLSLAEEDSMLRESEQTAGVNFFDYYGFEFIKENMFSDLGMLVAMTIMGLERHQSRSGDVVVTNNMNQLASYAESLRVRDGDYENLEDDQFDEIEAELPAEGQTITVYMGQDEQGRDNRVYCAYTEMISDDEEVYCIDHDHYREKVHIDRLECTEINHVCQ